MKRAMLAVSLVLGAVLLLCLVSPARPDDGLVLGRAKLKARHAHGATAPASGLVLGKARLKAGSDCGCGGTGNCTICGDTCFCRPAGMKMAAPAHAQTARADDGGPDWTWSERGQYWYRVRAVEAPPAPPAVATPYLYPGDWQPAASAYQPPQFYVPQARPAFFGGGFGGGFARRGGGGGC